ncbi:hypothetical protein CH063_04292 [Colletotrichum higginsianum]|uniref:Uncharacterized protein n=1 Tax=Colletotrichum higginsianum (strain IMI 349063) TaxID=759273 RepID=H1W5P9_COLHI|nr:hypothetical protein CH063_04292 [Colletotrichum higginsianum]
MSSNQILSRKALGSYAVAGRTLKLSAATKTTLWKRTDSITETFKEPLEAAIYTNQDVIPANTAEICTREPEHQSESDSRSHITAVCYDDKGNVIKSVHLVTKK